MKSVIEQGTTVAKAIEAALKKADMPQEFFVKLLEHPESGFLGFGAKKAKVALFFKKEVDARMRHRSEVLSQDSYKDMFGSKEIQKAVEQERIVEQKQQTKQKSQKQRQQKLQGPSHRGKQVPVRKQVDKQQAQPIKQRVKGQGKLQQAEDKKQQPDQTQGQKKTSEQKRFWKKRETKSSSATQSEGPARSKSEQKNITRRVLSSTRRLDDDQSKRAKKQDPSESKKS